MRSAQPPAMATRLLERLGSDPMHEALVGDLVEQYRQGRSRAWFWRQALAAVLRRTVTDVRGHKLLALRALAIGWGLYFALSFPVNYASGRIRFPIMAWFNRNGESSFATFFWATRLPSTLLVYAACFAVGWLVARLHRGQALTMVCLFSASVLVVEYTVISAGFLLFPQQPPPGYPTFALVAPAVLAIGRPLSVLLGGLSSALTQPARRAPALP
jgi:hypothetical protein